MGEHIIETAPAALVSDNPTAFSIHEQAATPVTFLMEVDEESVEMVAGIFDWWIDWFDQGGTNACGGTGSVPSESCNGRDDDCDGLVDEGVTNACGTCGSVSAESCNGRDDDCDGSTDEGLSCRSGGCTSNADCPGGQTCYTGWLFWLANTCI